MKTCSLLVLLVITTTTLMAEAKAEALLAIVTKVRNASLLDARALIQVSAEAPEEYLTQKLKRIQGLDPVVPRQVRGVLECTRLVALALEESPGDIDPILFVQDGTSLRLLINLTRLRDSGLEKDEQCIKDHAEIDRWIQNLKKK
jgi:hypothetical protein